MILFYVYIESKIIISFLQMTREEKIQKLVDAINEEASKRKSDSILITALVFQFLNTINEKDDYS